MNSTSYLKRIGGIFPLSLGLAGLLLPVAVVEVSAFGLTLSSDSYTLLEIMDLLEQLGRDTMQLKVFIGLMGIGSVLCVSTVLRRWLIGVVGVIIQILAVSAMLWKAMSETGGSQIVEATPQIGFYLLVLAPVSGLLLVIAPLARAKILESSEDD